MLDKYHFDLFNIDRSLFRYYPREYDVIILNHKEIERVSVFSKGEFSGSKKRIFIKNNKDEVTGWLKGNNLVLDTNMNNVTTKTLRSIGLKRRAF